MARFQRHQGIPQSIGRVQITRAKTPRPAEILLAQSRGLVTGKITVGRAVGKVVGGDMVSSLHVVRTRVLAATGPR